MNQNKLNHLAFQIQNKIIKAKKKFFTKPFDHIVIDEILPKNLAFKCAKSFPKIESNNWDQKKVDKIEVKYRSNWNSEFDIPENIIDVVEAMTQLLLLNKVLM